MKRFLIIGYGVVGKAVYSGLYKKYNVEILDPPAGHELYPDYNDYDGIIMCLPTPQGPTGECDDMLVEQYHYDIRKNASTVPILIKSTISIELIDLLEDDRYLTTNPEFLTEADSKEEFMYQKFSIFGGRQCLYWCTMFQHAGIKMNHIKFTDIRTAAYAKYAINTFLATKVIFFNELKSMFGEYGYDELTHLIGMDERIGTSHMMVPGPDQQYGFGGMCFPKDTSAFAISGKGKLTLLEKVININTEIRDEIKK
jgi:UDP-glucose 6-dehydrogenase|tara:strand:- start:1055 stop:1819 length:765 start_codon:yes stop_codon:yes gene_type:complete